MLLKCIRQAIQGLRGQSRCTADHSSLYVCEIHSAQTEEKAQVREKAHQENYQKLLRALSCLLGRGERCHQNKTKEAQAEMTAS